MCIKRIKYILQKNKSVEYSQDDSQIFKNDLLKGNYINSDLIVSQNTSLVVEGYPRSGNTYFVRLIQYQRKVNNLNILNISHHTHRIENIKLARFYNIPIIILIRNPYDSIASYIIYNKFNLPAVECIRRYIYFYNFVLEYRKYFLIVKFESVTTNPNIIFKHIKKKIGVKIPLVKNLGKTSEAIASMTLEFSLNTENKEKHIFRAATPVPERNIIKKDIINKIKKDCDSYMVTSLYNYLISNYAV